MKLLTLSALFVVSLSAAACAGSGSGAGGPVPEAPLEGAYWKLFQVYGKPVAVADENRRPHLVFSSQDGRLAGSGGCNRLTGTYRTAAGGAIEFGPMGMTHMACVEGMEVEADFLKALGETRTYTVEGKRLTFYAGGRAVAVFESAEGR